MRQAQIFYVSGILILVLLFASASFLPQLIFNMSLAIITKIADVLDKQNHGEDIDLGSNVVTTVIILMILELSVYNNYKAKAQLFLRIKASEQQGEQLNEILDTVPDNVLICAKPQPAVKADESKAVVERVAQYANLQMKLFFGCDLIKVHSEIIE